MSHGDRDKGQTADNTHGDMGSVAVSVNGEVPSLGGRVGWSGVAHSGMSAPAASDSLLRAGRRGGVQ